MSKIVSATTIDAIIEELDTLSDEQYEKRVDKFAEAQPVLIAYLFNEDNFHLLTEEEKGFLQYLALIAYEAVERTLGNRPQVSEDEIGEAEEKNYEILENSTAKKFRDRLDTFFEGYKQEELLAFAEEAVMEDEEEEDSVVTKEGREPIFITMKTLIDVLTAE
jgi:hypothetical protein